MQKELTDLKKAIKRETGKLICETHPSVCALRDQNYNRLESLLVQEILSEKYEEPPSIQTALASLEMELG